MFRRSLVLSSLFCLSAGAAIAAPELDADTSRALWCAIAFEQIEPAVREQDEAAGDQFITYATALRRHLATSLAEKQVSQADVDQLQSETFSKVIAELADGGSPSYAFGECQTLATEAFKASLASPPADKAQ